MVGLTSGTGQQGKGLNVECERISLHMGPSSVSIRAKNGGSVQRLFDIRLCQIDLTYKFASLQILRIEILISCVSDKHFKRKTNTYRGVYCFGQGYK